MKIETKLIGYDWEGKRVEEVSVWEEGDPSALFRVYQITGAPSARAAKKYAKKLLKKKAISGKYIYRPIL